MDHETEEFEENGAKYEVAIESKDAQYHPTWRCLACGELGSASGSSDYREAVKNGQDNFRWHAAEHAPPEPATEELNP